MTSRQTLLFSSLLLSCSGTDTGNPPVIDLQTSGCRERYGASKTADLALQSLAPEVTRDPLYDGLTCFVWSRADDRLTISLTNYETGCFADRGWSPRAELAKDGALELVLADDECSVAACGWCVYDLSFTIEDAELLRDREVRLYERGCDSSPARFKRAMLPLGSQQSGAVCTYAHYVALQGFGAAPPGQRGACGAVQAGTADAACSDGQRCVDLGANEGGDFSKGKRCLATCASDADCDALSRCEAGACRLSATGLTTSSTVDAR